MAHFWIDSSMSDWGSSARLGKPTPRSCTLLKHGNMPDRQAGHQYAWEFSGNVAERRPWSRLFLYGATTLGRLMHGLDFERLHLVDNDTIQCQLWRRLPNDRTDDHFFSHLIMVCCYVRARGPEMCVWLMQPEARTATCGFHVNDATVLCSWLHNPTTKQCLLNKLNWKVQYRQARGDSMCSLVGTHQYVPSKVPLIFGMLRTCLLGLLRAAQWSIVISMICSLQQYHGLLR